MVETDQALTSEQDILLQSNGWIKGVFWFKHILFHNQRTALRLYQLLLQGCIFSIFEEKTML